MASTERLSETMTDQRWKPGDEVEIIASRIRLRSLRPTDVGDVAPSWYGDKERRRHIWSPNMPETKFLKGLAEAADNVQYFALLAFIRETGEPIGLSKGQVMNEGADSLYVATTLLGDRGREGLMWGYEMTSAALWFAMKHLPVTGISMRIYEDNEDVVKMTKLSGYRLHRTYAEDGASGRRNVLDLRKTREEWLARYEKRFSRYLVQCAPELSSLNLRGSLP